MFEFFYDINGIPWQEKGVSLEIQDGMNLSDDLIHIFNDQVSIAENFAQVISYGSDGIKEVDFSKCYTIGEIYKEKQQVITIQSVFHKIKEYFDKIILEGSIKIYEVSLVYAGYYSDINDGEIRNVTYPFWTVKFVKDKMEVHQLLFDAYTGKFVQESDYY